MPLLVSPIDGQTPMQQITRDGVQIDRCPVSGGIWLDRGELEKLLQAAQEVAAQDRREYMDYRQSHPAPAPRPARAYDDDDYEDYYKRKHGKKSGMARLFDIFD